MSEYEPIVMEAARDVLASLETRPGGGSSASRLRDLLAREVREAAVDLGVPEREVWGGLRRVLEERGYEFPADPEAQRETWTRQVARRAEAVGDRLVRKGLLEKGRTADGQTCWAVSTALPPAIALRRLASLDARERAFFYALSSLSGRQSLAG